jgi:PAS domain-containing protein
MAVQFLPSQPDTAGKEHFILRIFDSFAAPLAIYDRDFRILKVNQALLEFDQRSSDDVIDKHCYEIFHRRNSVCENCHVQEVFKTGTRRWREMLISINYLYISNKPKFF